MYCLDADDLPHFLWGFSYNGPWLEPGLSPEEYGTGKSALPDDLADLGTTTLPHNDNCVYAGPLSDTKANLQKHFMDPAEWNCLDDFRIETPDDQVRSGAAGAALTTFATGLLTGTVMAFISLWA